MPSVNVSISNNGPLIQALIGISAPRKEAMEKAGIAVPAFVSGTFLIDTGAYGTCVDPALVRPLSLTPSGSVSIQTPSTNGTAVSCNQYDVAIFIPGAGDEQGFFIPALPILETGLASQGIDGLIGRDILDRCTLIYIGSGRMLSLAF